jgi:orotidine-5'-phosphate decarboxylase
MNNPARPKNIPAAERLILALDLPDGDEARRMVEQLGDAVRFYKLGLELFMAGGYFELMDWLLARDLKVFVDLKFFDVPRTVRAAVSRQSGRGASFATVHGNDAMLQAAAEAKGEMKILAVTALTSLDEGDLKISVLNAMSDRWCCPARSALWPWAATAWCRQGLKYRPYAPMWIID